MPAVQEPCPRRCRHGRCPKPCGDTCPTDACSEPCDEKVQACGHDCIGLCGEECICRECNPDAMDVFFGTEDDEGVRCVCVWAGVFVFCGVPSRVPVRCAYIFLETV